MVDVGEYLVNLYFFENYSGIFKNGVCVFDVYLEGNKIVDSFDVFVVIGKGNIVLVCNILSIKVSDGYLILWFIDIKFIVFIFGIEVMKIFVVSIGNNSGDSIGVGNIGNVILFVFIV